MCNCQQTLWAHASEVGALGLVVHATEAAKSHIAYSRALASSRRAEALIGEGAGKERAWAAEQYFSSRTSSLRRCGQALEEFRTSADPARIAQADERIAQGAAADLVGRARYTAVIALLDSDLSADAASSAMTALDQRFEEIRAASSFGQLTELLARYTQEHIARTYEDAALNDSICLLILIITSLYAYIVVIVFLECQFFPDDCTSLFDQIINQLCPGTITTTTS